MRCYEFILVLAGGEISEADADRLYEAGCDDGTIWTTGAGEHRATRIGFSRDADRLEAAIKSAVADVARAGFRVSRIELDSPEYCAAEAEGG